MLTRTDRLEKNLEKEAVAAAVMAAATDLLEGALPAPVLLRSGERRWFGASERIFTPQNSRAHLLRPRVN